MRIAAATYERAVEEYLREHGLAYLGITQSRRSLAGGRSVKNFDFLVRAHTGQHYLVEVKGRQFPYVNGGRRVFWENWLHEDDIEGLRRWRGYFGFGFTALICYAYCITDPEYLDTFASQVDWQRKTFGFVALTLETFMEVGKQRSLRWQALHVPSAVFRQVVAPLSAFLLDSEPGPS